MGATRTFASDGRSAVFAPGAAVWSDAAEFLFSARLNAPSLYRGEKDTVRGAIQAIPQQHRSAGQG